MLRAILLAVLLQYLGGSPVFAGMAEECGQSSDPALRITGCTAIIDSGTRTPSQLIAVYYNRGIAYHMLRQFRLAIADYDRALLAAPRKVSVWVNRGNAYDALGAFEQAVKDYSEALRLNPKHSKAYNNRGNTYRDLGDYDNAVRDWEKVLKIEGRNTIRVWQTYLKEKGYYVMAIDGVYGRGTRWALFECARDPDC